VETRRIESQQLHIGCVDIVSALLLVGTLFVFLGASGEYQWGLLVLIIVGLLLFCVYGCTVVPMCLIGRRRFWTVSTRAANNGRGFADTRSTSWWVAFVAALLFRFVVLLALVFACIAVCK